MMCLCLGCTFLHACSQILLTRWSHTYMRKHTCTQHTHPSFLPNGFGIHANHNMTSPVWKKRVLLLLADTSPLSLSVTLAPARKFFNFQSALRTVLAAQACCLLLPLETQQASLSGPNRLAKASSPHRSRSGEVFFLLFSTPT